MKPSSRLSSLFAWLPPLSPVRPSAPRPPVHGRWPAWMWVLGSLAFLGSYGFLFAVIHPLVDTRACVARFLDDPLMRWIPATNAPLFVTHTIYYWFTGLGTLALALRAARGDHGPMLRWGFGLSFQALLRSLTLVLAPLCRVELPPGTIPFEQAPTLDLGFARIPWRMWATNDLLFSGHVGEFFLMYLIVRRLWPWPSVALLCVFQVAQALSLIATRGHYTIDIVVALPCAFCADAAASWLLRRTALQR